MSDRFFLLTGCSCGGKSTLLNALSEIGFDTVSEPGRRIIAEETAGDGKALPWVDMKLFALRAVDMARSDLATAQRHNNPVFFDRGLIDAAVALEHSGGQSLAETLGEIRPYAEPVFLLPPWEELFAQDTERRHDFEAAVQEYHRIGHALDCLGYNTSVLPCVSLCERVEMVLNSCAEP